MKLKTKRWHALFLSFILISSLGFAHDECLNALQRGLAQMTGRPSDLSDANRYSIIPSGRDDEVIFKLKKLISLLMTEKTGLMDRLGVPLHPSKFEFVQGTALDALAAQGVHPSGTWVDGQKIYSTLNGGGVTYEFVAYQKDQGHSYYRDNLPFPKQATIVFHVIGHLIYEHYSGFKQKRTANTIQESLEYYALVEQLYRDQDHDEVSEWHQFLETLIYSQDFARGTQNDPDEFKPELRAEASGSPWVGKSKADQDDRKAAMSFRRSANLFQAFLANLPPEMPSWKKEMAKKRERMARGYSGGVSTKIQNEGFAAFMQEFLPEFLPEFATEEFKQGWAELMRGVAYPHLRNPYFTGLQAWRRIYKNFMLRAEVQKLNRFEQAIAFMAYAIKEVISKGIDDFDFLSKGLDDQWIRDRGLFLGGKISWNDWDPTKTIPPPPPPGKFKHPTIKKVITRDPSRIRSAILRTVADHRFTFPRPVTVGPNWQGRGVFALEFDKSDEVGSNIPLTRVSAATTLYIYSRFIERPVSLKTVASSSWMLKASIPEPWSVPLFAAPGHIWNPWWSPVQPKVELFPIRIEVTPSGKIQVFEIFPDNKSEKFHEELTAQYQKRLDEYIDQQTLVESDYLYELKKEKFGSLLSRVAEHAGSQIPIRAHLHTPTAPRAISEFIQFVERRLLITLQNVMKGKGRVVRTGSGVRVKVLPDIPSLRFDRKVQRLLLNQHKEKNGDEGIELFLRGPRDRSMQLFLTSFSDQKLAPFNDEDPLELESGGEGEGERYWGEGVPEGDGAGPGSGDEESEEGDQPGGNGAGEGGEDPSWIEIPASLWAELLEEYVTLPNLKPKKGDDRTKDTRQQGVKAARRGVPVYEKIAERAYMLGLAADEKRQNEERAQGKPEEEIIKKQPFELVNEGLKYLRPEDWRVKDRTPDPQPEINAVIFYAMDMSGSMWDAVPYAKKVIFDLNAVLKRKYKNLKDYYVAFDTNAHVFESAEKFFQSNLGGGTSYKAGFDKVKELEEKFPASRWDRYVVVIGDMDDFGQPQVTLQSFDEMRQLSEYVGVFYTPTWSEGSALAQGLQSVAETEEWVGFVKITDLKNYSPMIFRELFKNGPDAAEQK